CACRSLPGVCCMHRRCSVCLHPPLIRLEDRFGSGAERSA
ncbi:MAG: hypothetical protein AVDCRST_MAG71-3080, partial [uncultured Lysobacter sp.]